MTHDSCAKHPSLAAHAVASAQQWASTQAWQLAESVERPQAIAEEGPASATVTGPPMARRSAQAASATSERVAASA
jgi:hypothetical protein